jgi:hypothetical protein
MARKVKPTRRSLDKYFNELEAIEENRWSLVIDLEKKMQKETGIKDLEFVWVEGCIVGIGTPMRAKKLPLIHR